ncbi:MAG: hypothetical protein QG594_2009, partial [Bacteroidota bacterium]|nr:hypothetical protein [Bacteroidota bacterium]
RGEFGTNSTRIPGNSREQNDAVNAHAYFNHFTFTHWINKNNRISIRQ